ncbi:hypothetical protein BDY19DRAFT_371819 [Irpex rosettiformis]|uniref:Uncharacterized protein n=1 Tax=Irpex rosettiformis TaxID=378272 RepID=A0ACB8TW90_9APHY|nr:hypothetical protein BDY19DRAFT_371819 [Irpex rosettiformis]
MHPLSPLSPLLRTHEMSDVKGTFINKFTKEEVVRVSLLFCALGGVCTSMTTYPCCRLLESFDDTFSLSLESKDDTVTSHRSNGGKTRNLRSRTESNLHCILRRSHVPSKDHQRLESQDHHVSFASTPRPPPASRFLPTIPPLSGSRPDPSPLRSFAPVPVF